MSNSWLNVVWESDRHKGAARLVLLALADHADDQGRCWPSVARIARRAAISERQCQRILAQLEADGDIEIKRGDGRKNTSHYLLKGDIAVSPLQEKKGDTAMSPFTGGMDDGNAKKGDIFAQKGDIAVSPDPPKEPIAVGESAEPATTAQSSKPPEPTPTPIAQPTQRDPFIESYEQIWGRMVESPYIAETIHEWSARVTLEGWRYSLKESAKANARNWKYLGRVLERIERDGTPVTATVLPTVNDLPFSMEEIQ